MRKCDICGHEWDEQFLTTYENINETDNTRQHNVILVCEECDHACECDEETGDYTIEHDGIVWRQ